MSRRNERERLREIVAVFLKHGVTSGIKGFNDPKRIRMALEELGPTFIKIGQILSLRPDLLPESFIKEFEKLQDNVKPEGYEEIEKVFEGDFKKTIGELFLDFETVPIASASLAQAHLATLKSGQRVVVKIQRPRARETILSDIAILRRLGRFIKYTSHGSVLNIQELVEELFEVTKKELDFLNEAKNIKQFFEYNKDVKCITCPNVYEEYTTTNVLVMDYIEGLKIADTERLEEEGYDLQEIGEKLANNFFKQVFEDGFFHADPHPGNIIIHENKIAYIDFGMVGTLNKGMKDRFNKFLSGVASRDIGTMTQGVLRIAVIKGEINMKNLYSDVEEIYNKYIDVSLYEVDLRRMIGDVFKVLRRNSLSVPREITMLLKGIMTIEGVVAKLVPDINIMGIAVPYIRGQILRDIDYKREITEQLENLYTMSKSGIKIPGKLVELINGALSGKLKVQMEHSNLEKAVNQLNRMVNRVVFALIVSSLIIGSSLVVSSGTGPKFYGISAFGFIGYAGAVIMGLWLLISIIRSGRM